MIRLLSVALLWPQTKWGYLEKITPLLMYQAKTHLSPYDLTVHILGMRRILHTNCTPIALNLLPFTSELLWHNRQHPNRPHMANDDEKVFDLAKWLKSTLSECDGYVLYGEMIEGALRGEWQCLRTDPNLPQFDLGEFVRSDRRLVQVAREVSNTRLIN